MGFCMGGGLALQAALNDAGTGRYAVAIPFYGSPLTPEQAAQVKTPILGMYGADDQGIPAADVKAMQDALTAAEVDNSFTLYEGAPHAFFNDTRESQWAGGGGGCVGADAGVVGEVFGVVRLKL